MGRKEKAGSMLLGQQESRVDQKNRIGFPKRFRAVLGEKLIVTHGYEKSLIIVSEEGWKALLEGTEGKPFIQSEARETQRFLLGGASFIALDSKGRFILPHYLKTFANIQEEVIFLGLSRYVELWGKEQWDVYHEKLVKNIDTIANRLTRNGERTEK